MISESFKFYPSQVIGSHVTCYWVPPRNTLSGSP